MTFQGGVVQRVSPGHASGACDPKIRCPGVVRPISNHSAPAANADTCNSRQRLRVEYSCRAGLSRHARCAKL